VLVTDKKKRLGLALAVLATLVALATVAATGAVAKPAAPSASKAAKLTKIDVGLALIPPKMTFIGLYVAKEKGFFAKNGLDVNLEGFDGGVKSLRGVASGSVDVGCTAANDVVTAATQGGGIKAFWSYDVPLDTTLVADQSVKTLADLKGKKIGITDPGGFADIQARAVLARAKISPNDVQLISLASRSALLTALVSGQINATVFHADDGFAAQERDHDLHPVEGIFKSLPLWWYGSCEATTDYIKANADTLRRFITAVDQADRWMYSNPGQTIAIGVKDTQQSIATVTHAYQFLAGAHGWTVNAGLPPNRIVSTMQHLFDFKQIPRVPGYREVADPTIANAVVKKIGIFPKPKKIKGKLVYAKGWF
jgi:NitT/TauT family transport system substrate-binding protein